MNRKVGAELLSLNPFGSEVSPRVRQILSRTDQESLREDSRALGFDVLTRQHNLHAAALLAGQW